MMMKNRFYIAGLFLLFCLTTRAFALAGDLTEPGVALPKDFPEAARTNIMKALRRPDCKFLGGHFLNSFTSLSYGGDTKALNFFLDSLAKCPGVTLSVSFVSEHLPHESCDWNVGHEAFRNRFDVRVNLKSSRIKLEQLVIPEARGPNLPQAK